MGTLLQDVRYGARMLLKRPSFTAVAVISLALGISANTAIFSVVDAILLKSLPYKDADRIILIWGDEISAGVHRSQVSATDVDDWRHQTSVFEDVTTYGNWSATFLDGGEPERISGIQVGDGYFQIMKGTPLLGRVFLPEEQEEGKDNVLVLDYGLWQRRFGGNPNIVGQKISLSGKPYTVVGVMPADFQTLPKSLVEPQGQFYRPVAEPHDETERASRHLRSLARLKEGATLAQAQSEMNVIAKRLAQAHPDKNTNYGVRLITLPEDTVGGFRATLWLLFGAVAFVLLIACANVGNLLLSRSTARQKELAIRAALGAGRMRLVRQLLTESVLLALVGGGLGLLLALWGTGLVESLGSQVTPLLSHVEIDYRVLTFTVVISLAAGIIFGLAPALHVSQPDLNETLKEGGRASGTGGAGRNKLRGLLVVSEIAMALVLLVCASLLIKSVMRLRDVNPGFNPQNVLTMNISLPSAKYPNGAAQTAFYNQILGRIQTLPGVQSAGVTSVLPFSENFDGRSLAIEDQPRARGDELSVDLYIVTPGYLRTLEIPLTKGRTLAEADTENAPPAALINETMARELWPNQDPIGKRVKFPGSEKNVQPWRTVVGVVKDVKQYGLDKADKMQLYLPEAQFPTSVVTLVVRTAQEPAGLIAGVRNEIRAVDKDQAVYSVATMKQLLADSISLRNFSMLLLLVFAVVALTLAAIGIYGVVSYTVTQRTHEIGIRIALGAKTSDVLKLVVNQGMKLVLIGVTLGLVGAFAATRLMSSLLFGISATDPLTFIVVSLLLAAVALVACLIPARRAMKVDPMVALRYE